MQHPVCWLGKIASTICTSFVRLAILAGLFGSGVKTLDSFALVTVGKQFHGSARRLVAALLFLRWDSSLTSFQWILHRERAVFCLAAAATKVSFLLPILFFFPHVPSLRKHCCVCDKYKWMKCENFPGSCFTPPPLSWWEQPSGKTTRGSHRFFSTYLHMLNLQHRYTSIHW